MEKITILIADDHTLVRETWSFILNTDPRFTVVAESGSGEDAVELAKQLRPNIVIMDISLPGIDGGKIDIKIPAGIQSGEQLRQRGAGMSVLNGRGRGDLVARVLVETPTKLNSKQKKILEEFRETETGDECPASKSFFSRIKDMLS